MSLVKPPGRRGSNRKPKFNTSDNEELISITTSNEPQEEEMSKNQEEESEISEGEETEEDEEESEEESEEEESEEESEEEESVEGEIDINERVNKVYENVEVNQSENVDFEFNSPSPSSKANGGEEGKKDKFLLDLDAFMDKLETNLDDEEDGGGVEEMGDLNEMNEKFKREQEERKRLEKERIQREEEEADRIEQDRLQELESRRREEERRKLDEEERGLGNHEDQLEEVEEEENHQPKLNLSEGASRLFTPSYTSPTNQTPTSYGYEDEEDENVGGGGFDQMEEVGKEEKEEEEEEHSMTRGMLSPMNNDSGYDDLNDDHITTSATMEGLDRERHAWEARQEDLTSKRKGFNGGVAYAFGGVFCLAMYGSADAMDELGRSYTEYVTRCQWGPTWDTMQPWMMARRYREFDALDGQLRSSFPDMAKYLAELPPKEYFSSMSEDVINTRRKYLEEYMTRIVHQLPTILNSPFLDEFLHISERIASIKQSYVDKHGSLPTPIDPPNSSSSMSNRGTRNEEKKVESVSLIPEGELMTSEDADATAEMNADTIQVLDSDMLGELEEMVRDLRYQITQYDAKMPVRTSLSDLLILCLIVFSLF